MKTFIYSCDSLFCPTEDITILTTRPTDVPLSFEAGQYVEALLNNQRLPLSIANSPQPNGELVFHLRHNQAHPLAQYWLNETKQSGRLMLQGPFGQSTLAHLSKETEIIFLAGGTGFAPIRALLAALCEQQRNINVKLFWGISHPEDAYDLSFLQQVKMTLAHFETHFILSNPSYVSRWDGPIGWAHDYCLHLTKTWENNLVYASGPFAMIKAAFDAFTKKGLCSSRFLSDMLLFSR